MTGVKILLEALSGRSQGSVAPYIGKTIKSVNSSDDRIVVLFEDGSGFVLEDDGQNCCERRYLKTDDRLSDLVGERFISIEQTQTDTIDDDCDAHEIQFVDLKTDKQTVSFSFHNEHNGYYGGFWLVAKPIETVVDP